MLMMVFSNLKLKAKLAKEFGKQAQKAKNYRETYIFMLYGFVFVKKKRNFAR